MTDTHFSPAAEIRLTAGSGRTAVRLHLIQTGQDWQAVLSGGERPHIGAVVLAVPRPSLCGDAISCDCWVTPVAGHKDYLPAQTLAEQLCRAVGCVISVSAGIHCDNATPEELRTIQKNCRTLTDEAVRQLRLFAAAPSGT